MSYAQLKAFHAVASEGSVLRAAKKLNISQPAISIHLKALETEGCVLFRRIGHRLELNHDGLKLFDAVDRMIRAERDADQILSSETGGFNSTLVVGADGPHVALKAIEQYQKQHPTVQIVTIFGNASETWHNLLDLKVDVAIMAGAPDDARVAKRTIARQKLVALVSTKHRLAACGTIALDDLAPERLIFRERGSNTQRAVADGLRQNGFVKSPAFVLGSREAVVTAVAMNLGVGFAYDREVSSDTRVKALPVTKLQSVNQDQVVWLKTRSNTRSNTRPNIRHVAEFVACAEKLCSTGLLI